jgi:hypothetical protein
MIIRYWVNEAAKEELMTIKNYLPTNILEHTLNLIEEMDMGEIDIKYRSNMIHLLYRLVTENDVHFHCSSSKTYDAAHEFCLYLDGWLFEIESENPENGFISVKSFKNNSPLA